MLLGDAFGGGGEIGVKWGGGKGFESRKGGSYAVLSRGEGIAIAGAFILGRYVGLI